MKGKDTGQKQIVSIQKRGKVNRKETQKRPSVFEAILLVWRRTPSSYELRPNACSQSLYGRLQNNLWNNNSAMLEMQKLANGLLQTSAAVVVLGAMFLCIYLPSNRPREELTKVHNSRGKWRVKSTFSGVGRIAACSIPLRSVYPLTKQFHPTTRIETRVTMEISLKTFL